MPPERPGPPGYLIDVRWGVAYDLHRVSTGIGRDASNPVVIRDLAASRSHAEVRRDGGRYVLHALGSAETRVNGAIVAGPRVLAEGDVIEIAYTRLRFTGIPPTGDVVPAPVGVVVDADFAGRKTEIREIVSTAQLRRLRRQVLRPVELHWWMLVVTILAGSLVLALLIRLAIHLFSG